MTATIFVVFVLAGKQKGYDYPTFLTCYKVQERKKLSKIPLHVLELQFQCVPLHHDDTHNHPPSPSHIITPFHTIQYA